MKTTNFYLAVAAFTSFALTACTSEELINDVGGSASKREPVAMSFDMHQRNQTRAEGESLPLNTELDNFGVWAVEYTTNNSTTTTDSIMKNYQVKYDSSKDTVWYYNGIGTQTTQYWKTSTDSTVFYAYAPYKNSGVTLSSRTLNTTITSDTALNKGAFMVASLKNVANDNYGNDVDLHFTRLTAKVRIAFYETIENYGVKIKDATIDSKVGVLAKTVKADKTEGKITKAAELTATYASPTSTFEWNYSASGAVYGPDTIVFEAPKDTISHRADSLTLSTTNYYCVPANTADANKNDSLLFTFKVQLCTPGTGVAISGQEKEVSVLVPVTAWASNTLYTYVFHITEDTTPPTPDKTPIVFGNITVGKYTDYSESQTTYEVCSCIRYSLTLQYALAYTLYT